ncbi:ghrelin/obestatin prepropeptide isoform X1 [Haplochromis burtoni]|uniref:Ghrelin-like n=2 Tax=Pseudocrenilabrinae TaxID=318546 RepID=A0A3Q3CMR0_HAPBU|nr:ghrelin/obestatin prepropeptide isoform X1 [Haplochromis burtoni]
MGGGVGSSGEGSVQIQQWRRFSSTMLLKRNTCLLAFLLCSLTLWCKSTSAGSSFLSPSQKPQNKVKSSRIGRQAMEEPNQTNEDKTMTISAPFEIGVTLRAEDLADYIVELQEIVQRLLGNTESAERPSPR